MHCLISIYVLSESPWRTYLVTLTYVSMTQRKAISVSFIVSYLPRYISLTYSYSLNSEEYLVETTAYPILASQLRMHTFPQFDLCIITEGESLCFISVISVLICTIAFIFSSSASISWPVLISMNYHDHGLMTVAVVRPGLCTEARTVSYRTKWRFILASQPRWHVFPPSQLIMNMTMIMIMIMIMSMIMIMNIYD